jgi:hypothetical protein
MDPKDKALVTLGKELQARNYRFTTITPATHHRVNRRPASSASALERVFGWSQPFKPNELPEEMLALLEQTLLPRGPAVYRQADRACQ